MHILFIGAILDPAWPGGEPRIARMLASSLSEQGIKVSELFLIRPPKKMADLTSRIGVRALLESPCLARARALVAPEIDISCMKYYRNEIKRIRPDIVMTWFDYDLSAFWASILMKTPTIVQVEIFWPLCPKWPPILFNTLTGLPCDGPNIYCDPCSFEEKKLKIYSFISSIIKINKINRFRSKLCHASAIISDSIYLKNRMVIRGYPDRLIHVIYNGVDVEKIEPSPLNPYEKTVLFLSGLNKAKGIEHFVRLAKGLKPEFPNVRFLWVGQTKIEGETFEVHDYVWNEKQLNDIYASAYLVLLPSLWPEPMSFTVLEAMAHGKPVVAYDTGANNEEIIHGKTGFLSRWGDIKQLQFYVRELLLDEKLAEQMGQNARKFVESKFSQKCMTHKYVHLLNEIWSRHQQR